MIQSFKINDLELVDLTGDSRNRSASWLLDLDRLRPGA